MIDVRVDGVLEPIVHWPHARAAVRTIVAIHRREIVNQRITWERAGRHVLHEVREDGNDLRELSWILPDLWKVPEHGLVSRHVGKVSLPALVPSRQRPHDGVRACGNRSLFRVKALASR